MIRVVDAGKVSGIRSQSIYHGLAKRFGDESHDTIVLVIPEDPYFCVGYFQDPARELDLGFCEKESIPVVRRETGGGAVFIDRNQLFVQWIFHPDSLPRSVEKRYQWFIEPIVQTYRQWGIEAYFYPVNDIHVHKKKIAGLGGARLGEAMVVTGNFLLDFDYDTMLRGLNVKDMEMRVLAEEEMRKYLTTVKAELGYLPDLEVLKKQYVEKCMELLKKRCFVDHFIPEELEAFEKLDEKMLSEEWLFKFKKEHSDSKMLKIHSGVWIGYIDWEKRRIGFQIRFDKLAALSIRINGKSEKIMAFDEMPLSQKDIRSFVNKRLKGGYLAELGAEQWTLILERIVRYRMQHG